MDGFARLVLNRFSSEGLLERMWELRSILSAYDATYVALTEMLGASALVSIDVRLARAPGIRCLVEII